ncbi:MAG: sugar phosphate nucleotidyltransferase [Steroidobacteraceae bacterium]
MVPAREPWVLVLAGGDGRRLRELATDSSGIAVPKQYCSLCGGETLLQATLRRAQSISRRERICAIVAAQHECWWRGHRDQFARGNLIVQPENRGTANGILLSALLIARRDRQATIVILPSDHHFMSEDRLTSAIRTALADHHLRLGQAILLGIAPDTADTSLGYILPSAPDGRVGSKAVSRFIEKPNAETATHLLGAGALWNSLIVIARVATLLRLFERRLPGNLASIRSALATERASANRLVALARSYQSLPHADFSRDVLEGEERSLRVQQVGHCGWSDLGTPQRIRQVLGRLPRTLASTEDAPDWQRSGQGQSLNLEAQHTRLQAQGH